MKFTSAGPDGRSIGLALIGNISRFSSDNFSERPLELSNPEQLTHFFEELGRRYTQPAQIYLFGGSALLLIGSRRETVDVDFTLSATREVESLRQAIAFLAAEQGLDLEESIPSEFMPLPAGANERHRLIGQYGSIQVYMLDPYSIALMKIDRAFETDMQDVQFMIQTGQIELGFLEHCVDDVARRYEEGQTLRRNFKELRRGL